MVIVYEMCIQGQVWGEVCFEFIEVFVFLIVIVLSGFFVNWGWRLMGRCGVRVQYGVRAGEV